MAIFPYFHTHSQVKVKRREKVQRNKPATEFYFTYNTYTHKNRSVTCTNNHILCVHLSFPGTPVTPESFIKP